MRIGGVRVSAAYVRLLVEIVEDAGFHETAQVLADAIRLQAVEAPLTIGDHEAILTALGGNCPSGLAKLRRALLEEHQARRRPEGSS